MIAFESHCTAHRYGDNRTHPPAFFGAFALVGFRAVRGHLLTPARPKSEVDQRETGERAV